MAFPPVMGPWQNVRATQSREPNVHLFSSLGRVTATAEIHSDKLANLYRGPRAYPSPGDHSGGGHGAKMRTSGDSRQFGPVGPLPSLRPTACTATAPNSTRLQLAATRNVFTVAIRLPPSGVFEASSVGCRVRTYYLRTERQL